MDTMLAQAPIQVYSASQADIVFGPTLPNMIVVFQPEADASFAPTCRNADTPICYPPILMNRPAYSSAIVEKHKLGCFSHLQQYDTNLVRP